MTDADVIIVGAGPAGLMMAGELALAGAGIAIVERRASQEIESPRSGGLHSRTIEVLDQRGIADRFLAAGQVGARVLHNTRAQRALAGTDERTEALRGTMAELLTMDEPRKRIAGMICGLDIHYDHGDGHPLLGRRMPDLDLVTASGPRRVFTLLHGARPVLLNLGEPGSFDITPWADRVRLFDARYAGRWELPLLGEVGAPAAVLIRPDGHVAWVGEGTNLGLPDALTTWFGPPTPGAARRAARSRGGEQ